MALRDRMRDMDERELAEALEASKDDVDAWGEQSGKAPTSGTRKSEKRQRGVVVSVRLTPAEFESVQRQAEGAGHTVSGYLRHLAEVTDESSTPDRTERPASPPWPTIVASPPSRPGGDGLQTLFVQTTTDYVHVPSAQI